ncbi:type IV pilus assembly protein PilM [Vibrio bivalvicida]|uniref:Type IV pilus assembly protein PilM n=1 Tax=Vibrio bivalvicida TaxID=1276888 RepID=A0ABV4MLX7_9VIBR
MGKSLVTGIEIGHHSIKAVVLKPNKGAFALVDYQELPIEVGIFPDNHMSNYQKIVKKLKELRKCLPRFSSKVALAIPDNAVISKILQIDSVHGSHEIEYAITQAFSNQSPFPIEELNLDYVQLSHSGDHSKASYQVYATKKEVVEQQAMLFKSASFQPIIVDTRTHALIHIWQIAARANNKSDWLLVNVDFECSSLCIDFPDKAPYCKEVVLDNNIGKHQAERSIAVGQQSKRFVTELLDKIQRSLQLIASVHGVVISGVWLSGPGANTVILADEVTRRLHIECEYLNPLSLLTLPQRGQSFSILANGYRFTSAAGIALRGLTWLEQDHVA